MNMKSRYRINEIIKPMGVGVTSPHLVELDDGKKYVLKFLGNPEKDKALINELIAFELARKVELPIIPCEIVYVDFDCLDTTLISSDIEHINGYAFASKYNTKANPVNTPLLFRIANNKCDALKIMIFDFLIGNEDRNKGNLLFDSKFKRILVIDHTHVFSLGTMWDEYQLPRKIGEVFDSEKMNRYNYDNLIQFKSFGFDCTKEIDDMIIKIKEIDEIYLQSVIQSVKIFWNISFEEESILISYLLDRTNRVDEILKVLNI